MSQQPDSSPRITRRLETPPVRSSMGQPGGELATLRHALMRQVWDSMAGPGVDLLIVTNGILGNTELLDALSAYRGWRPPAQVIESADHLDTLPIRTVIADQWDTVWRHGAVSWFAVDKRPDAPARIVLPVTVVHIPTEIGDTE